MELRWKGEIKLVSNKEMKTALWAGTKAAGSSAYLTAALLSALGQVGLPFSPL